MKSLMKLIAADQAEGGNMIPSLLFAREFTIRWVNFWIAPVEHAFDMIESELQRRGVDLSDGLDTPPETTV
jgi:hypothetical protein